jgi:flagellar M-ring protein FliF
MNNLTKLGAQLRDIWKQLGFNQRLTVISATVLFAAGLIGVAYWSSRTPYSLLYGKLSSTEASKVITALDNAKVPYEIGAGGSSILVPEDKVYSLRMQLAGQGIPNSDGVGFEIFDKPNFGISDFVQRTDYMRAVDGELARTISQIDAVESARVMIVMPENRLLLDQDKYPTASVFVHVRGGTELEPQTVNAIRFLVANSVEGLKPNHVTVVDNLGDVLSANDANDSLAGLTSSQLAAQRGLEQYLDKKAQDILDKVLGPGQAIVRVSAQLNFDTLTRTSENYDPDGQVISSQTKNSDSTETSSSTPNVAAGISANTSTETNSTQTADAPVTTTSDNRTTSSIQYEISKTTSNLVEVAGGVKRLTAAVTVAEQTKGTGAKVQYVKRSAADLQELSSIVANAIGLDPSRGDTISLEEMPFNDQFATQITHELDQQQKQQFWWELAKNITYPALGLIALFVLFRLFKRTPVQDIPIGVPVGRLMAGKVNGNGSSNGNGNGNGHGGWTPEPQPGVVTVDVLNRLIKENPVNMTQAIRDWMNREQRSNQ